MAASQCPNCKQFKYEEEQPLLGKIGLGLFILGIIGAIIRVPMAITWIPIGLVLFVISMKKQKSTKYKCKNCSYEQTYKKVK